MLIHESGHWIAVRLSGGRILSVSVELGGLSMLSTPLTNGKKMISILCGPLVGFLPALLCRGFPELAVCSFLLTVYNLIPVRPLDGGRALELILHNHSRLNRLIEIMVIVGGICFCLYLSIRYKLGVLLLLTMVQLLMKNRKLTCKRGSERVQ